MDRRYRSKAPQPPTWDQSAAHLRDWEDPRLAEESRRSWDLSYGTASITRAALICRLAQLLAHEDSDAKKGPPLGGPTSGRSAAKSFSVQTFVMR